ncbi:MAG: SNF2-related protein [Candidatus Fimivivens sp.]
MGTGKTITRIAITGALYEAQRINRVLVVAPLSILGVWDEEFRKFADFDYSLKILSGTDAKKADALKQMQGTELQVAVVNYESAWRLDSLQGFD